MDESTQLQTSRGKADDKISQLEQLGCNDGVTMLSCNANGGGRVRRLT